MNRISVEALREVRDALKQYEQEVEATRLRESARRTYVLHAEHFVRWLSGDFEPGTRLK